ncbi:unnamed protein product [Citrullus colocynthis]|uniref:Secreted protein n=1 Tax=Citrullus colocynthis TaxID=252529 RepID=A0ABP0XU69_9ROSI
MKSRVASSAYPSARSAVLSSILSLSMHEQPVPPPVHCCCLHQPQTDFLFASWVLDSFSKEPRNREQGQNWRN